MATVLRPAIVLTSALLVLCCGVYPAAVTAFARGVFPRQAAGSLLVDRAGRVRGSSLLGQSFADPGAHPEYFWGRPSAASVDPATGLTVSGGSNLGPGNPSLGEAVRARESALRAAGAPGAPADLTHASGSGLDPHVSLEGALAQVDRVARARGMERPRVEALVRAHVEEPALALLGDPGVNVLRLNLALDAAQGR